MLDEIVTDGMRVAAEVRRRMDEAQKELDRGGSLRGVNNDDDEDDEGDADLLEGADALVSGGASIKSRSGSVRSGKTAEGTGSSSVSLREGSLLDEPGGLQSERRREGSDAEKSTMFDL